ncbi:hypothetical protein CsSME_00001344 [Camellia sinensis var. sinensis]
MHAAIFLSNAYLQKLFTDWNICCRKDGQDTKEELQKRNLRDELEERERWHFLLKDKSYSGRETIEIVEKEATFYWKVSTTFHALWARRDAEDRLIPRSVDADDADVELKSSDGRLSLIANLPELIHMLTKSLYQWPDLSTCGVIVNLYLIDLLHFFQISYYKG